MPLRTPEERSPYRQAFLGFLALFLVANVALVLGLRHARWDADGVFCPNQMLVSDHARAFQLLLWNPWINGGSPDGVDPQVGAFSPICVLWGFLAGGSEAAFRWYWLSIWFAGGAGMFVLARHWHVPAWGCFVAAASFSFSGFFIGHASHTTFIHAYSALPWMIWRLDIAVERRSLIPAVEAGAVWGLSGLAGYPGVIIVNVLLVVGWVVGRVVQQYLTAAAAGKQKQATGAEEDPVDPLALNASPSAWKSLRFAALTLMVFGGIGAVVMSPAYVGFAVETKGFSPRSGPLTRDIAVTSNSMGPIGIATLSSPHLATHRLMGDAPIWGHTDPSSLVLYVGAVGTWLAVLAVLWHVGSVWRWWLVCLGVLGVALAVGDLLPLRGWLYDLCPPTRYFRHTSIFRGYLTFVLPALAALGCRDIARRLATRQDQSSHVANALQGFRATSLIVATVATIAYLAALWVIPQYFKGLGLAAVHLAISWGGVAAIGIWGVRYLRTDRSWALVRMIVVVTCLDVVLGMQAARSLVSWRSRDNDPWQKVAAARDTRLSMTDRGLKRQVQAPFGNATDNKNVPIKVPSLLGYQPLNNNFHRRWADNEVLAAMAVGENRIWFAESAHVARVQSSKAAQEAFVQRAHQTHGLPLVVHDPEQMLTATSSHGGQTQDTKAIEKLRVARPMEVELKRYDPTHMEFAADVPADGYLLVTDRWAPGWRANVNQQSVPVEGGAFIFRAIPVRKGRNEVAMSYRPFGFPYLLGLSWGTMALVTAMSLVSLRKRQTAHNTLSLNDHRDEAPSHHTPRRMTA